VTADPVGDALHADAEAARAEIRAAGISCPSCGVNMADLDESHMLTLTHGRESEDAPLKAPTAQCNYGKLVTLAASSPMTDGDFEAWQAAANIALMDDFRRREHEAFARILGGLT
jgi:hypothetical protein